MMQILVKNYCLKKAIDPDSEEGRNVARELLTWFQIGVADQADCMKCSRHVADAARHLSQGLDAGSWPVTIMSRSTWFLLNVWRLTVPALPRFRLPTRER